MNRFPRKTTNGRRVYMVEHKNSEHLLKRLGSPYALMLYEVVRLLDRNMNRYHSDKENRALVMKRLDIPEVTYHRRLKWLVKKGVLARKGRGVYGLNVNVVNIE